MTNHDHEAMARQLALALLGTLDEYHHLPWCLGTYDDAACDLPSCRQVRAAVRVAREAGLLAAPTEAT